MNRGVHQSRSALAGHSEPIGQGAGESDAPDFNYGVSASLELLGQSLRGNLLLPRERARTRERAEITAKAEVTTSRPLEIPPVQRWSSVP